MKYGPIHHPTSDYRIAVDTDIRETWRRHGFKKTTDAQRLAQQQRPEPTATPTPAPVKPARKPRQKPIVQRSPLRAVGGASK